MLSETNTDQNMDNLSTSNDVSQIANDGSDTRDNALVIDNDVSQIANDVAPIVNRPKITISFKERRTIPPVASAKGMFKNLFSRNIHFYLC